MIEFNRIYVIESLPDGEEKTGTALYNDLLRWQENRYEGFSSILIEPQNKNDWNEKLKLILDEASNGFLPIIHFEIHGSTNKDGLVLVSGELVSWCEMRQQLVEINIASRMNLFVSLAVCHGAYLLTQYHLDQRAFCYGVLGSFDAIPIDDLKIRFQEFYQELFETFSITKAYQRLLNSNQDVQVDYECISALEIFYKNYRYYLEQVENPERVKERALGAEAERGIELTSRPQRRDFQRKFAACLHKTKEQYYQEHITKFMMLDLFPERQDEFNLPSTLKEFMSLKVIPQNYIEVTS